MLDPRKSCEEAPSKILILLFSVAHRLQCSPTLMQSEAYFVLLPPDTLCGCLMCILPGIWEYLFNIGMITSLTVLTLKNAELFQNVLIIDGQSSKGKRYLAWCGIPADVT